MHADAERSIPTMDRYNELKRSELQECHAERLWVFQNGKLGRRKEPTPLRIAGVQTRLSINKQGTTAPAVGHSTTALI